MSVTGVAETPLEPTTRQTGISVSPKASLVFKPSRSNIYDSDEVSPDMFTTEKSRKIWNEIVQAKTAMADQIAHMEDSFARVLAQHEYEYAQAYNIFVKNKEAELKQLIDDITQRLGDKVANDRKMKRLELNEFIMREKANEQVTEITQLRKDIQSLKVRITSEQEEKTFYHSIAIENKKQNKLLKVSLTRLNDEYDTLTKKHAKTVDELALFKSLNQQLGKVHKRDDSPQEEPDNTFLTKVDAIAEPRELPKIKTTQSARKDEGLTKDRSLMSISARSSIIGRTMAQLDRVVQDSQKASRRVNSVVQGSRYAPGMIPTENLKFE